MSGPVPIRSTPLFKAVPSAPAESAHAQHARCSDVWTNNQQTKSQLDLELSQEVLGKARQVIR